MSGPDAATGGYTLHFCRRSAACSIDRRRIATYLFQPRLCDAQAPGRSHSLTRRFSALAPAKTVTFRKGKAVFRNLVRSLSQLESLADWLFRYPHIVQEFFCGAAFRFAPQNSRFALFRPSFRLASCLGNT